MKVIVKKICVTTLALFYGAWFAPGVRPTPSA